MATPQPQFTQQPKPQFSRQQQQFSLDDYVLQDIDNRAVDQADYNTLTTLLQYEGVRISKRFDPATRITSTRGQQLQSQYFIKPLRFPHGFGTQGIFSMDDTITPEVGEDSFFIVEQQKQGTAMLEARETTKEMINYLVYSMYSNMPVLILQRPFKNVFHKIHVYDGQGTYFGTVTRRSGLLSSKLLVADPQGSEIMSMKTSKMHGWNDLWIKNISTKEKSGMFTTRWTGGTTVKKGVHVDTLDVIFPTGSKLSERCLLIAAGIYAEMIFFD